MDTLAIAPVSAVRDTLAIVGLIVSVLGGALGAFAILVTWKLYQASNEVNLKTLTLLHKVHRSSHTAEVTSTRYTEKLVTTLIELVERNVTASLTSGEDSVTRRIDAAIRDQLGSHGIDEALVEKIRARVLDDVKDTFKTIQLQAAAVAQIAEAPGASPAQPSAPVIAATGPLDPAAPKVIRWLARNEKKYEFFAVSFLQERIFAGDPDSLRGLRFCLSNGLLEVYDQPNPKNLARPTRACRLNHSHPQVKGLLA
jgi:hypothetical protein